MSAPSATGDLTSTPFCELLVYALSQDLTGSLVLECPDRTKHAVLFAAGAPVKARVSHAATHLGQVLLQLESVDAQALQAALEEDSEELLGQRLFARGALQPEQLASGLAEQLLRQLSWLARVPPTTAFAYFAGADLLEDWGGGPLRIDPLAAIWRSIEAHAPKERVAAVLGGLADKTLRLHPDSRVARFDFNARVRGLLDVLKVKPQGLPSLEATRLLDQPALHKLLYALTLTRHLDTGFAPVGVVPGARVELTPRRSASSAAHVAIRPGQSQLTPAVRAGQSQLTPAVRVGQAQSAPKMVPPPAQTAPARAPVASPAAARPPAPATGATRAAPTVVSPAVGERISVDALQTGRFLTRDEIDAKLSKVDELTHYEFLELPVDATAEQLAQAFPSLARRWHPDRLSPEYGDLREAVTRVFARMTEASRVLGNPVTRKSYDESLGTMQAEQLEQEQVALVLRSAEAFQKAEILLKKRDLEGAEQFARSAHEGDPDQPEYAALYAWIRSRRADATEQDVAASLGMLKKAITKQGNNVKIHYYLACVLKAAGQSAAALREFRHVANHDPSNVDAARELRLHDMRRGNAKEASGDPGLFGKIFKR